MPRNAMPLNLLDLPHVTSALSDFQVQNQDVCHVTSDLVHLLAAV
jgi:hypothetical protein